MRLQEILSNNPPVKTVRHEVYPDEKIGVTLKSSVAIQVYRDVMRRTPREKRKKPVKVPTSHMCLHCGLNLARKKFCCGACRVAAFRLRPPTASRLRERQAVEESRMQIGDIQFAYNHGDRSMEFDGRYNSVGRSQFGHESQTWRKKI